RSPRRARDATFALRSMTFVGTHPKWLHSPPSRSRSASATRKSDRSPSWKATSEPVPPPPITKTSNRSITLSGTLSGASRAEEADEHPCVDPRGGDELVDRHRLVRGVCDRERARPEDHGRDVGVVDVEARVGDPGE